MKLLSIKIENFKGIKKLEVKFGKETEISGKNRVGKSTIQDAFLWCLRGIDSLNRTNHEIRPRDPKTGIENLDLIPFVELTFDKFSIAKKMKVKYKPTGEQDGNAIDYIIDGISRRKTDFDGLINSHIPDAILKLITSPSYFFGLKTEDQRNFIISLAGAYEPTGHEEVKKILEEKKIKELKEINAAKKRKAAEKLKEYPIRIEELENQKSVLNFDEIRLQIVFKENEIKTVETQINDVVKSFEAQSKLISEKQNQISVINKQINDNILKCDTINFAANQKFQSDKREIEEKIKACENSINSKHNKTVLDNHEMGRIESVNAKLRIEIKELATKTFAGDLQCPVCKVEFSEEKKTEITENFKNDIAKQREQIKQTGVSNNVRIAFLKFENEKLSNEISVLNEEKTGFENESKAMVAPEPKESDYKSLIESKDVIQAEINSFEQPNTNDLTAQKNALQKELDSLRVQYGKLATNDK